MKIDQYLENEAKVQEYLKCYEENDSKENHLKSKMFHKIKHFMNIVHMRLLEEKLKSGDHQPSTKQ
jgi:hypothetical protein